MIRFSEKPADTMFQIHTNIVMYYAPMAVFAAIAYTVGHMGLDILYNLFKLLATLYVALIIFLGCVLVPIAINIQNTVKAVCQSCLKTGYCRICHLKFRVSFGFSHGMHGTIWNPA